MTTINLTGIHNHYFGTHTILQVATDVGRGRSWLRLALNDGLLGAYLQAMQKDR